jgi:hypothetical protein
MDFPTPKFLKQMGQASMITGAIVLGVGWLYAQGRKLS